MYTHAFLFSLLLLFSFSCRPKTLSNFGVGEWFAYDLGYKKLEFKNLRKKGLILNFYSPICEPCIKELPALELLYSKAQSRNFAMFLALSPQLALDLMEKEKRDRELSFKEKHKMLERIIRKDIYKYSISIPFVIMGGSFQIGPQELVQATPETLIFHSSPLRLEYNFIGALSYEQKEKEILADSRFQFALEKLEEEEE